MKDLHTVLRQKLRDVERVRQEIQTLRNVIRLLADDQPLSDSVLTQPLPSSGTVATESSEKDMSHLEIFYPFVRHMRKPERK